MWLAGDPVPDGREVHLVSTSMLPFNMVDPTDWDLDLLLDRQRARLLLDPPCGEGVIALLCRDAMEAARRGAISPRMQDGDCMKGCIRAHAAVPVTRDTFDLLINGRSGYRAQYYLSAAEGALFNRLAVMALMVPLQLAWRGRQDADEAGRSFAGPWSKIAVTGDSAEFFAAPTDEFRPRRWLERNTNLEWLTVPLPENPSLDIKGTWLADEHYKQDPDKADRDADYHERGFA